MMSMAKVPDFRWDRDPPYSHHFGNPFIGMASKDNL
jgi:hypothetical protein